MEAIDALLSWSLLEVWQVPHGRNPYPYQIQRVLGEAIEKQYKSQPTSIQFRAMLEMTEVEEVVPMELIEKWLAGILG